MVGLVADGKANAEIAGILGVSRRTVESRLCLVPQARRDVSGCYGSDRTETPHRKLKSPCAHGCLARPSQRYSVHCSHIYRRPPRPALRCTYVSHFDFFRVPGTLSFVPMKRARPRSAARFPHRRSGCAFMPKTLSFASWTGASQFLSRFARVHRVARWNYEYQHRRRAAGPFQDHGQLPGC